jgi:hypothetical protein
MNCRSWIWAIALAVLAQIGSATAQVSLRGPQTGSGLPLSSSASGAGLRPPPTDPAPLAASSGEPKNLTGMLAAQNDARKRVGLPALTWSADLASKAEATVRQAAGQCSSTAVEKLSKAADASTYWAAPSRRIDGEGSAQDIRPSYLVSQWKEGGPDYDFATGKCRESGACEAYARMVAPAAKAVGCAKTTCNSQAQVWACLYSQ